MYYVPYAGPDPYVHSVRTFRMRRIRIYCVARPYYQYAVVESGTFFYKR